MTSRSPFFSNAKSPFGTNRCSIWPLGEWLLVGVATPLLLFPGIWSFGGLFLIGIALFLRQRATGLWRLATPADPAIALILLTAFVGVMISVDRALTLNRATVLLLGWLLYESTVMSIVQVGLNKRLFILFAILGLQLAAMSLTMTDWAAGILVPIPSLYDHLPQINLKLPGSGVPYSGGLFNPRTVAGGAALLWPINGVLAISGAGLPGWQRLLHALAALLLIGVIFLSQSPQGVLAFGAALFVLIFWWSGKWTRRGLIGMVFVMVFIAIWGLVEHISTLLPFLAGRAGFGLVARFELWIRAVRMIRTAPLTGIGLNNYSSVMDALYPGYVLGPEAHAHNLYLQTLTDQGILGLFGLLLFIAVTLWSAIKIIQIQTDELIKVVLVAVIATVAGWLSYCLLEVLSLGHKPGILLWGLLALPIAFSRRKGIKRARKRLWLFSAIFTILTSIMIWQTGYLTVNIATITAQQTLFDNAFRQPAIASAHNWLDLAEERLASEAHLYRLRALLHTKNQEPEGAAHAFRELAALELTKPLWWWAPAPYLSGEWPYERANKSKDATGLALIYQNWYIRFPDRVEPVALLAYTYADGMGDKPRAISFIERALLDGRVNRNILESILADLNRDKEMARR